MNCESTSAGIPLSRSPLESVVSAVRDTLRPRASVLFAQVRDTFARRTARDHDDIADMNAHMLRDVGMEGSQLSRIPERRDVQFPRL
jgi:hypothetical protein